MKSFNKIVFTYEKQKGKLFHEECFVRSQTVSETSCRDNEKRCMFQSCKKKKIKSSTKDIKLQRDFEL